MAARLLRGLPPFEDSVARLVYLMRRFGINDFDAFDILQENFSFGGYGLSLEQLQALQSLGYGVPELGEDGQWASPLIESLVVTARRHRLALEARAEEAAAEAAAAGR